LAKKRPSHLKARKKRCRYVNSATRYVTADPELLRQLPQC
jgi:hypothetical protein